MLVLEGAGAGDADGDARFRSLISGLYNVFGCWFAIMTGTSTMVEGAARTIGAFEIDVDAEGEIQSSSSQELGTAARRGCDIAKWGLKMLETVEMREVTEEGWCDSGENCSAGWERQTR